MINVPPSRWEMNVILKDNPSWSTFEMWFVHSMSHKNKQNSYIKQLKSE